MNKIFNLVVPDYLIELKIGYNEKRTINITNNN